MPEDRKPQSADKYIVRFPAGMRDRIAEAAKANNRSMNAEIVSRLEASFEHPPGSAETAAPEVTQELARLLRQQRQAQIEMLQVQISSLEDEIRRAHNPLAETLGALDLANEEGDATRISAARADVEAIKDSLARLDAMIDNKRALIAELRKGL